MCARNDSVLLLEKSKSLGIDKGTLLKHIELQELAWFGGDFRDDQSIPQYEPTRDRLPAEHSLGRILSCYSWLQDLLQSYFKKGSSMSLELS